MKKFFISALIFFISFSVFAQNNKSVFFEIMGNGVGFSLNFDSRFTKSEKGLGFRAGIGIIPGIEETPLWPSIPSTLTVPLGVNYLAGKAPHYFEAGFGATYLNISGGSHWHFWGFDSLTINGSGFLFFPTVGYRYAKTGMAFQGRILFGPVIGPDGTRFWGGLSVGYKF